MIKLKNIDLETELIKTQLPNAMLNVLRHNSESFELLYDFIREKDFEKNKYFSFCLTFEKNAYDVINKSLGLISWQEGYMDFFTDSVRSVEDYIVRLSNLCKKMIFFVPSYIVDNSPNFDTIYNNNSKLSTRITTEELFFFIRTLNIAKILSWFLDYIALFLKTRVVKIWLMHLIEKKY